MHMMTMYPLHKKGLLYHIVVDIYLGNSNHKMNPLPKDPLGRYLLGSTFSQELSIIVLLV